MGTADRSHRLYLLVVCMLGMVALADSVCLTILSFAGREPPPGLIAIGTAAITGVLGLMGGLQPPNHPNPPPPGH